LKSPATSLLFIAVAHYQPSKSFL